MTQRGYRTEKQKRVTTRLIKTYALYLFIPPTLASQGMHPPETRSEEIFPKESSEIFSDPYAATQEALRRYHNGDIAASVEALKYAASRGYILAQWKLGRMYADGDGVPQDASKAYKYFSDIIYNYDQQDGDEKTDPQEKAILANAFVAVGLYHLTGILHRLKRDPERALSLFLYAGTNFGDADGQYHLGCMYLQGNGVPKNITQAARWLNLAANKDHAQAQATLGQLLFRGEQGIMRQRALGLMWLILAREQVLKRKDLKNDSWVIAMHDQIQALANDNDREIAKVYAESRLRKKE